MAVTLPLILFLFDYIEGRKLAIKGFTEKIPYISLMILYCTFIIFYFHNPGSVYTNAAEPSLIHKLEISSYLIVFYLGKFFNPVKLMCIYPYPEGNTFPPIFFYGTILFLLITTGIFIAGKFTKKIPFAFLFFVFTLLPVLQWIPIPPGIAADRYTYIPFIGPIYILSEGIALLLNKTKRYQKMLLILFVAILIASFSDMVFHRCKVWTDPITLFSDLIKKNPKEGLAYLNRSEAYMKNGNKEKALTDLNSAISIGAQNDTVFSDRAKIYFALGDYQAACSDLDQAIKLNPSLPTHYFNRGVNHEKLGENEKAMADYNHAITMGFNMPVAAYRMSILYNNKKNYAKALEYITLALKLGTGEPIYYLTRGEYSLKSGNIKSAIGDFEKSICDDSVVTEKALYYLGELYRKSNNPEKALSYYEMIIIKNKNSFRAYEERAFIFAAQEKYDRARNEIIRLRIAGGQPSKTLLKMVAEGGI